jgi:hypothetical protein
MIEGFYKQYAFAVPVIGVRKILDKMTDVKLKTNWNGWLLNGCWSQGTLKHCKTTTFFLITNFKFQ